MSREGDYHIEGEVPETPQPTEYPAPWGKTEVVGTPRPRIDAYERVSGAAVYPSDLLLPDMLYGAVLRCPHARARVTSMDADAAAKMPGVAAVLTLADAEAELEWRFGAGERVRLLDPECEHEGEPVAAVAAETPQQAADALRAIVVAYEVLPHLSDEHEAMAEGATQLRVTGNRVGEAGLYERGDVTAGFAEADQVLEETYRTEYEIHSPMENHGCVARWDGQRLIIWESLQGVFPTQSVMARTLGIPLANVQVVCPYMGGGFGSKLQPSKHTVIACVLAKKAARPVKLFLSREEEMLVTGNRPGATMRIKAGVTSDGRLTAMEFESLSSPGGHVGGGAGLLDWQVRDLYTCDNVSCKTELAFINAGPARPFRAPGHPQGSWALEQMMDALAESLAMDPIELRLKNVPDSSQARGGVPYSTTGLRRCLEDGGRAFGWKDARSRSGNETHLKRGVGVASCVWIVGGGGPPSTIIVKMYADGSVNLNMGASDIGTGTRTVMAAVAAEELGIDPDGIQVENADTGTTQFATPSGGSKTVPTESPAVREAAFKLAKQLREMAAEQLETTADELVLRGGGVRSKSNPEHKLDFSQIEGLRRRGVVVGIGYRGPNPEGKVVNPFAAQFCEVEVNTLTGEVKVLRFLGAHDSGRVLNRLTFDNQVFGGITMGVGLAMTEERVLDRGQTGRMVNANLHDYKIPTAMDVPAEMTSMPVDLGDTECNTTGAKGVGEPVTIPTAAAIANAVYNATGVRVTATPINPVQMAELLAGARKEA